MHKAYIYMCVCVCVCVCNEGSRNGAVGTATGYGLNALWVQTSSPGGVKDSSQTALGPISLLPKGQEDISPVGIAAVP
jgi:hypothetical protein